MIEGSKLGDPVLWLGQFAFARRTETPKGEHLVTGVFRYLKAEVAPYEQLQFPLTVSETDDGLFSVGIVFRKEDLAKAVQLEKKYAEVTPFILVKGTPERVTRSEGMPVVRIQVEKAWSIERTKINIMANRSPRAKGPDWPRHPPDL